MKRKAMLCFVFFLIICIPYFAGAEDFAKSERCKKAQKLINKAVADTKWDTNSIMRKQTLYSEAIRLCPDSAQAHNNLGDIYEKLKMYQEAIKEYKKAINLNPDAYYPYLGLGDVYFKMRRYKEAIYWYKRGLKKIPDEDKERYASDVALINQRIKQFSMIEQDIKKKGVISKRTIKHILSSSTRGPGGVVSISFGEALIPFDFNKYEIREDAKPQLNELGKALKELFSHKNRGIAGVEPAFCIEIAGHTDIRGSDEYNLWLSRKRAKAVVSYLVQNFGLPKDRFIIKGYGERQPICVEGSSETKETPCNAMNRRVEIIKRNGIKTAQGVRGVSFDPKVCLDVGFFKKARYEDNIKLLKEGDTLFTDQDYYFFYFKPLTDCYVYILQEDSARKTYLLFPTKGTKGRVVAGRDYWVPGFGRTFRLDEVRGEEKVYFLAVSSPLNEIFKDINIERIEQVKRAVKIYSTRAITVVPVKSNGSGILKNKLLSRIEGEGGWVRVLKFRHE